MLFYGFLAQGCHASIAAIVKYFNSENTKKYISELESMHKVVLKAESEQALLDVSKSLTENNVEFVLWTEQPENIPACLATAPNDRNTLKPYFKKFKLYN